MITIENLTKKYEKGLTCNICWSMDEVKLIRFSPKKGNYSNVVYLCSSCRKSLYELLIKEMGGN